MGQQARLEVVDELVGVVAKRPKVNDAPTALHEQQLVEGLQAEVYIRPAMTSHAAPSSQVATNGRNVQATQLRT